jgi:glycosyltransferase involved in cell wall biosynthesis
VRILFAANEMHVPDNIGGAPMAIHHMALNFQAQGHDVAVVAALSGRRRLLGYRVIEELTKTRLLSTRDIRNGYETFRAGHWRVSQLLRERLRTCRPDVVIAQGTNAEELALVAAEHDVPAVMRLISDGSIASLASAAQADRRVAELLASPLLRIVSVSNFIAGGLRNKLGLGSSVIYPPIRLGDCVAHGRTPRHITFINPVPVKGVSVVLQTAKLLPQREFVFVEAWQSSRNHRRYLRAELAKLPNVTFQRRCLTPADIYRSTALLLVPSQWPEAFGRVIVEASVNGIPVIASRVGGIPEAIGESGILLERSAPASHWAQAIEEVMSEPAVYSRLAASALANASREEFTEALITAQYLSLAGNYEMETPSARRSQP